MALRAETARVCSRCGGEEVRRIATHVLPLGSFEGGSLNVQLEGVEVRRCLGCGRTGAFVPCLDELLWKVTETLLLSGNVPEGSERWQRAKAAHVRSFAEGVVLRGADYAVPVTAVWECLTPFRGAEVRRAPWWVSDLVPELLSWVSAWRPLPGEPVLRFRYKGSVG